MKRAVYIALLCLGFSLPLFGQRTITVDVNGGGDFTEIQPAIDAAEDGDTVLVKAGEYVITESITFLGKSINLRGENGPQETTIRKNNRETLGTEVVLFERGEGAGSRLEGFALHGGRPFTDRGSIGVHCIGSSPTVENCVMTAGCYGMYCVESSSPTVVDCTISGNFCGGHGIGCFSNSSPTIINCTITDNSARGTGGGGVNCDDSSPTITNCIISGNDASDSNGGGGVRCTGVSSPTLTNCTITGNVAPTGGGVYCGEGSSPRLVNCIVWDNTGESLSVDGTSSPEVTYSCLETAEVWRGDGNVNKDPLFVADLGDYHLSPGSPCIDAGTSEGIPLDDLEGSPRPCRGEADIGAYELCLPRDPNDTTPPSPLTGLMVTLEEDSQITIDWDDSREEDLWVYSVYRLTSSGGPYLLVGRAAASAFVDRGLENGATYFYVVTSVDANENESDRSQEVQGVPAEGVDLTPPGVPSNLAALAGVSRVVLAWSDVPTEDLLRYQVYRAETSGGPYTFVGSTSNGSWFTDTDVTNGTAYFYVVSAVDRAGNESARSREVVVTPRDGITLIVDVTGGGDFTEIQPAIDAAEDGDTVLVKPGEYVITESIDFDFARRWDEIAQKWIDLKNIVVRSEAGAGGTIIRMSETPVDPHEASVVRFYSSASTLQGFTLTGGTGTFTLLGNLGGGVYCTAQASPRLIDCKISGNSARSHGGGIACFGSLRLTNCTISGNRARQGGGVAGSSLTLTNCTVTGNSAAGGNDGGGVWHGFFPFRATPSPVVLTNCIVWGNVGGSLVAAVNAELDVSYSCLEREEVWPGEGNINSDPRFCGFAGSRDVFVDAGNPNPGDGSPGNPFRELAPALDYDLSLRLDSPCIAAGEDGTNMGSDTGTCEQGGASERVVHLAPGRYSVRGMPLAHGVSILGQGAEETVLEGTVYGLRRGARLSRLTVTGGTDGIVIAAGEAPSIEDCTIWGNALRGVVCFERSAPILTNCTITGNSSGVSCSRDSTATLVNCIVWGNQNGAIHTENGSTAHVSFCCLEGGWAGDGNIDQDPLFVGPGDYRLEPDSPCIDTGTSVGAPAFDIEGKRRPCGVGVDMGAYEFCAPAEARFRRGDANADGKHDVADPVFVLSYLFVAGAEAPSCKKAADANDSGTVDLTDAVHLLNFLFTGGAPPAEPFAECGQDSTPDDLSCDSFPSC